MFLSGGSVCLKPDLHPKSEEGGGVRVCTYTASLPGPQLPGLPEEKQSFLLQLELEYWAPGPWSALEVTIPHARDLRPPRTDMLLGTDPEET